MQSIIKYTDILKRLTFLPNMIKNVKKNKTNTLIPSLRLWYCGFEYPSYLLNILDIIQYESILHL